jgi:hypothetical protein
MGPRWGQRVRRADPTRPIAGPVSSLTSANNVIAGASPPEKRKVAGSTPALATKVLLQFNGHLCSVVGDAGTSLTTESAHGRGRRSPSLRPGPCHVDKLAPPSIGSIAFKAAMCWWRGSAQELRLQNQVFK